MKEGKITLSQKQLKTLTVINRFIDKSISRQQAAELLGLSPRQISRLKKEVLTSGAVIPHSQKYRQKACSRCSR